MRKGSILLLSGFMLLGLLALGKTAELDEVNSRLLEAYDLPLRWDNIEGCPEWLAGPKPRYVQGDRMHKVRLAPGEEVSVRLPARSLLRLVDPCGVLEPSAVEVWLSDGTGLFVQQRALPSSDGHSLLVRPERYEGMIARVRRPAHVGQPVDLALFTARWEPLKEIAPYRCVVRLNLPCVHLPGLPDMPAGVEEDAATSSLLESPWKALRARVRRWDEAAPTTYWTLAPGQPTSVSLQGPARFALETRLHYPPTESRVFQNYRVYLGLDGVPHQVLEYETAAEARYRTVVQRRPAVVGRREAAYLEIPAGKHLVTLDATAPLFLRLLRQKEPDYLLPCDNQPRPTALEVRQQGYPQVLQWRPWEMPAEQARTIAAADASFVAAKERLAWQLVRDNSHRDGSIFATMLLRGTSFQRLDYPPVGEAAEKIRGHFTFYRDLLPANKPTTAPQTFAWFVARRLRNAGENPGEGVVAEQHVDDTLDRGGLTSGCFVPLPTATQSPLVYRLPERFGPTLLRIAVADDAGPAPRELLMQWDEQAPCRLRYLPDQEMSRKAFMPAPADTALAVLAGQSRTNEGVTLDGRFCRSRQPGPLLHPGLAEFVLPPEIKEIRLASAADTAEAGARVAVQFRAAKPYRMSEREFLDHKDRLGDAYARAFLAYLHKEPCPKADPLLLRDLHNEWLPLLRLLQAEDRLFSAAVVPSRLPPPAKPSDAVSLEAIVRLAQQQERDEQWQQALESWTQILHQGAAGTLRRQALLGRSHALEMLGERFLAERQLRSLFLHDPDEEVRADARSRLEVLYQRGADTEALQTLYAAAALRTPTPAVLRGLADALLANGEYDLALLAALGLPHAERPRATMLRAAYQLAWWQLYDQLVAELPSLKERQYWQAQRAVFRGNYPEAAQLFRQAGGLGRCLADQIERGLDVKRRLGTGDLRVRLDALADWEAWQADQPGPYAWREETLARDYAGAAAVYNVNRDLYSHFYQSQPDRPVRLHVLGPVRLRLEVRPVHARNRDAPLDDWLLIREPGALRVFPITNNRPSDGLTLAGDPEHVPGTKLLPELELGPGLHDLEVLGKNTPLLVRVFARRPEISPGMLPPLTHESLAPLLASLQEHLGDPQGLVRLALRAGKPLDEAPLREVALKSQDLPARERLLALAQVKALPGHELARQPGNQEVVEAAYLFQDEPEKVVALPEPSDESGVLRRLMHLLWLAEQQPAWRLRAQVWGEDLFARHPRVDGLQDVHARLTRRLQWAPLATVQSSAGVRLLESKGWLTESPMLRARSALVRPVPTQETLVPGSESFVTALKNQQPTTLHFQLSAEDVDCLPPLPLTAVYQLDREKEQRLELRPGETRQMSLAIPAGDHSVRLGMDRPLANQFLRVRIQEQRPGSVSDLVRELKRTAHLATPQEPVRVRLVGPAWLRIDEFRGAAVGSRYHFVAGDQTLELKPAAGQKEALFRLFVRVPAPDEPDMPPRHIQVPAVPVPPPILDWIPTRPAKAQWARDHREPIVPLERPRLGGVGEVRAEAARPAECEVRTIRRNNFPVPPSDVIRKRGLPAANEGIASRSPGHSPEHGVQRTSWTSPEAGVPSVPPEETAPAPRPLPSVPAKEFIAPAPRSMPSSPDREETLPVPRPLPSSSADEGIAPRQLSSSAAPVEPLIAFEDFYRLGAQEDGTWALASTYRRRLPVEEDFGVRAPDEFGELRATHLYYDEWKSRYAQTDMFTRMRDSSGPTLGVNEFMRWSPDGSPWIFYFDGSGYMQHPGDALPPTTGNLEWSAYVRGAISQYREITPKLNHQPYLGVFGRALSMSTLTYAPGRVDQDIFTTYKAQHRGGFEVADVVFFHPWLDTLWWLRTGLVSNENFISADHVALRAGWKQLVGNLQVDAAFANSWFFSDEDRTDALTHQVVSVDLLYNLWLKKRYPVDVGCGWQHDLTFAQNGLYCYLVWYTGNGRAYRDYRPYSGNFLDERRRRAAEYLGNNRILD